MNAAGDADRQPIEHLGGELPDPFFVRRIGGGVDEAHRQGLNPGFLQVGEDAPRIVLVQRNADAAVGQHALPDLPAELPRDQGRRELDGEIVVVIASLLAHLQDVPEAFGGDQRGLGAVSLDQGVRRERGSVHNDHHLRQLDPGNVLEGAQPVEDRPARIVGRGKDLETEEGSAVDAVDDQIREGSANVDADPIARPCCLAHIVFRHTNPPAALTGRNARAHDDYATPSPPGRCRQLAAKPPAFASPPILLGMDLSRQGAKLSIEK